ncbi:MAG: hypothetical protein WBP81_38910 [Solirubrobacteraceae bacterium]
MGHQDRAVGLGVGLLQVVSGEQHGLTALRECPHCDPERSPGLDIHRHGRLVENYNLGIAGERHGEAPALGLPTGELLGALPGGVLRASEPDHAVCPRLVRCMPCAGST